MSEFRSPPEFTAVIRDIQTRLRALANTRSIPVYTLATRPTASTPQIIFVTDASSGSRYQGWDITSGSWVPLG